MFQGGKGLLLKIVLGSVLRLCIEFGSPKLTGCIGNKGQLSDQRDHGVKELLEGFEVVSLILLKLSEF